MYWAQVHERLGKLVTVRSRPHAIKLVRPTELANVQQLIHKLSKVIQLLHALSPGVYNYGANSVHFSLTVYVYTGKHLHIL